MARVKIKSSNPKDPRRKTKLLEILSTNDIYVTRLIPTNDGFIILTSNENELDKIFNNTTDKQLERNEFSPQMPPQLSANRSVLLFKVDNHIFENSESSIKEELQNQNEWVGEITQIYKFPRGNIIKVTFNETQKAIKALDNGLKMFSMKIAKYDMKQASFTSILTCFKCYQMEDHTTAQCKVDKSYKVCSECSSPNHTWRECKAEKKKCLSCNGEHSTLAMRCQKRKDIINQKRREEKERETTTYTEIAKRGGTKTVQAIQPQPANTEHNTMYLCMLNAHFHNAGNPGEYEDALNKILNMNNLPSLKVPDSNPPSAKILSAINLESNKANVSSNIKLPENVKAAQGLGAIPKTSTEGNEQQQQLKQKPQQRQMQQEQSTQDKEKVTGQTTKKKPNMTAKDIGLMIITSKAQGWPQNMNTESLATAMTENKIKFTFTDDMFEDQEVIGLVRDNLIQLKECFSIIDNTLFNKLRSGLLKIHSPAEPAERRRRLNS